MKINLTQLYSPLFACLTLAGLYSATSQAQVISINTGVNAATLVNTLVDPSVSVSNITETAKATQRGTFTNGSGIGISQGIILTNGAAASAIGPNTEACNAETADNSANGNYDVTGINDKPENDPDLKKLDSSNPNLYDICKLEFDFTVQADTLQITYVFGSEEYTEYSKSGSEVNDLFGFFISGNEYATPFNFALIPGSANYVGIKNVNQRACCNTYYVINCPKASAQPGGLQYNGYTKVLTSKIKITPGKKYHIKIAIADASDDIIDSGVLIKAASFANSVPVKLMYFTARTSAGNKNQNEISWATESETNSSYFELLRSADGKSFTSLYKVPGQGNSNQKYQYEFTDEHPFNGENYYRLKQVDFDGKEYFTAIQELSHNTSFEASSVLVNTENNTATLFFNAPANCQGIIRILDSMGRTLSEQRSELMEGDTQVELSTLGLLPGFYLIQVEAEDFPVLTARLVK